MQYEMDSIMDTKVFHFGWKHAELCKKSWQKLSSLKRGNFS